MIDVLEVVRPYWVYRLRRVPIPIESRDFYEECTIERLEGDVHSRHWNSIGDCITVKFWGICKD